jgi:electron transport complex protein RnfB
MNDLIESINVELPQYQCGRCDTPGCKPYATEIANGTPPNRCVPGGQETLDKITKILGQKRSLLNENYGPPLNHQVAKVIEDDCIGCKKCIDACPVDAIIGSANLMHTIIEDLCTGCELCIEPCPVDCIELLPITNERSNEIRKKSEKFFILKNFIQDGKTKRKQLNKNIHLNAELSMQINAKINKRSLNKNKALKKMQIGLLQANKNEKYVNLKDIDKLISTLKK